MRFGIHDDIIVSLSWKTNAEACRHHDPGMNIPTSDIELKKKIRTLCTVRRKNLWKELFEIASYFALLGAPDLALSLLRFAYSNVISQEDNRSSIHILTDAVIAAICLNQGAEDLSKKYPPPTRYVDHAKILPQRVSDWELHVRQTLTVGAYSANLNSDKLPKLAMLVKAKLLAQPGDDYERPTRMQESLNLLNEFLADVCPPRQEPASYEALQALILAADITASLGHEDQARDYLQSWFYFERLGKNGISCCDPLILRTLSNLIYSGILSNHSKLTREAPKPNDSLLTSECD
jgi:hypothetical protein